MSDMRELLLEIDVTCMEAVSVKGHTRGIVMIPFTGEASGPFFTGKVIGEGVDTQKIVDGKCTLSARYMLEGQDVTGSSCRIFIENEGNDEIGFRPKIVTDSAHLSPWETASLTATVTPKEGGVMVRIYREAE